MRILTRCFITLLLVFSAATVFAQSGNCKSEVVGREKSQAGSPISSNVVIFNVPSQNIVEALTTFAGQASCQLLFSYEVVESLQSNEVVGRYTIQKALQLLLADTELSGRLTAHGVIIIGPINAFEKKQLRGRLMNSKKNLLASTIAFFVGAGGVQGLAAEEVGVSNQSRIDEIIVTANKRGPGQSIQDTAMSITALTGDTIEKRGFLDLSDFAVALPGVSMMDLGAGDKRVFIRGLGSSTDLQALTSAYLGEMPLSDGGRGAVDLRLVDIERIEVLKGPQGTQYGSGSLSGTLRYIPVAPNLDNTEGSIEVDFATFAESDDLNESFTGVFNTPLIEGVLGLRVAAYHFEDAGIIDYVSSAAGEALAADTGNQVRIQDDADSATTTGMRASLLWNISNELNVNLTLGTQNQEVDASSWTLKDGLDEDYQLDNYQWTELDTAGPDASNDADYAGLVVSVDLGWAELISSSSFLSTSRQNKVNFFPFGGSRTASFGPVSSIIFTDTDSVTQEFRLSSQLDGPIQFLAGLYYEDIETERAIDWLWKGVPFTDTLGTYGVPGTEYGFAANGGVIVDDIEVIDLQQRALFGELSYQLNEVLEFKVGARHFDYEKSNVGAGNPGAVFSFLGPVADDSQKGETYKANLSFTPNDNALLYAQWSESFRLGRTQGLPDASVCDVNNDGFLDHTSGRLVRTITPDLTENIELGAKFTLLDNRLTLNTAVYQMGWVDRPQSYTATTTDICNFSVFNNVGEVRSEGVELELVYLMTENVKVDFSMAYNEAEFTNVTEDSGFKVGEALPHAPHITTNVGLEYNFDVASNPTYIRADINYYGEAESGTERFNYPTIGDYVLANLRVGINIDQWDLAFYGSNLTNEDAPTAFTGTEIGYRLVPRKLGLEAKYNF